MLKGTLKAVLIAVIFFFPVHGLADEASGLKLLQEMEDGFVKLSEELTKTVVFVSPVEEPKKLQPSTPQPHSYHDQDEQIQGSGSGVIITNDGYIITNNHVVGNGKLFDVKLYDGKKFKGTVIGTDVDTDLAIIKVELAGEKVSTAKFGDSDNVKVGQWVIAVGHPFGLEKTVTVGTVSGIGREDMNLSRYENFIQTDASINPGNSGGPLFNLRGEVIGINTAIINYAQGIGFAIPSNLANLVSFQLMESGSVARGWLGIGIQPLSDKLAAKFGVKEDFGILVNEVFEGDPASLAGIKPGDIIFNLNDKEVKTASTLSRLIAEMKPKQKIMLKIMRNGEVKTVSVELEKRKDMTAKKVINSITAPDGELGIEVKDILSDDEMGKKGHSGVLISKIFPNSLAERDGLQQGDVIIEVDRETVNNIETFYDKVASSKDESILFRIIRENKAFFLVVGKNKKEN